MKKGLKLESHYVHWGVTAFLVIVCSITFFLVLSEWPVVRGILRMVLGVLSPTIYGLMFAYLFNKLMTFLEKRLISRLIERIYKDKNKPLIIKNRASRIISVALTMVLAVLIIGGMLTLILPQLINSLKALVPALPGYFDTVVKWLTDVLENNPQVESALVNIVGNLSERLTTWLQTTIISQADLIISNLVGGVIGVVKAIANLLIGLVISVYVIYHKERFCAQAKKLVYGIFRMKSANGIVTGARFLDKTCGSFITSKLIDSLIVGVVCYFFMIIVKMPYPMLIAAIVGITNIIPFFGPFIGGIPSAVLILLVDPTKGLIFVIFIIILQQLDGNVLYPKIQGNSIGISGFWIIFSLLFFGGLFGFWGMLFGVPVFAVIYALIKGVSDARLKNRGLPTNTNEYKVIEIFDVETRAPVYKHVSGAASDAVSDIEAEQLEKDGDEPDEDDKQDN